LIPGRHADAVLPPGVINALADRENLANVAFNDLIGLIAGSMVF
jgi:adenine deaminase